jgi:serine/threonine protein kinase/WD40 repeat protein/tetratricopeptide (TPR) repeat protein
MDEQSIFLNALEQKSPEDRATYLAKACGDDDRLKARIEALIARHVESGRFMEKPLVHLDETILPDAASQNRFEALKGGLAAAFAEGEAVVVGSAGHSVLTSLGQVTPVPRVALRDAPGDAGPVVRPKSPEMPKKESDSRFQLQGEIARGGMGAILKGRDTDLGRDLAIKVLLDQHKDRPEVIQRFIEEAQIGGQLQHPGIAPIYELGQFQDRRPFFAMKLVKGETLSKLLTDRPSPATDRSRYIGIFEQICQTMAYAHSRGVIHRDLKPANIMVGAFGEVQVMDWGLAKVLAAGGVADEKKSHQQQSGQSIIQTLRSTGSDVPAAFGSAGSNTQMGSVMGTPAYMPPEQALGEIDALDERADVFGLGAILCEILTGKPPYVAEDGTQVFRMASRGKLTECFERLDQCGADADLIALAKQCLELEPKDRPRNAGVLAENVTRYVASVETKLRATETEAAVQTERLVQQQRSAGKLKKLIAGLAVVSLLAIGTSIVAGKFWKDADFSRRSAEKSEDDATKAAKRANEQRDLAQKNLEKADEAEKVAVKERDAARQAQLDALDQTYLATRSEIKAMRFARQAGWRSAALERIQKLVQLGSRNVDLVDLRSEALACIAEMDVRPHSKLDGRFQSWHIAYSPDEQALAIDGGERVSVFDLTTNREINSIPVHIRTPFAFHPSGALAVPNGKGKIHFHAIREGQKTLPDIIGEGDAMAIALNRSGDYMAVIWGDHGDEKVAASLRQVEVFSTATGESIWKKDLPWIDFAYRVAVALSPDGNLVATHGPKFDVNLYTVGSNDPPIVMGKLDERLSGVSFHPNGKQLVATGMKSGAVWDLVTRSERYRIHVPVGGLWDVAFSPDGQLIGSVTDDGIARFWDSRSGQQLLTASTGTGLACLSMAFAPTGDRFAAGAQSISILALEGRHECRNEYTDNNILYGLAFDNRANALIASGGGHASHVWKLNEPVASQRRSLVGQAPSVVRVSPDGRNLAQGFFHFANQKQDLPIAIWSSDDLQAERKLVGPEKAVHDIAFSPTGRELAAASLDGHVYFWDFESGNLLKRLKLDAVSLCYLNDQQIVLVSQDRLVVITANDGTVIREVQLPAPAASLVVTPDKLEALVGTIAGTVHRVRLADMAVESSRKVFEQPYGMKLALSANGKILAITTQANLHGASGDVRGLFIDPLTLESLAQIPTIDQRLNAVEFDPTGQYFAIAGNQIALWDLDLVGNELVKLGLGFGGYDGDKGGTWLVDALQRATSRATKAKIVATAAGIPGMLEKIVDLSANDPHVQVELAKAYSKQGQHKTAEGHRVAGRALYQEQLQKDPENASLVHDLLEVMMPPMELRALVSKSIDRGDFWRYTTTAPDDNWTHIDFDDSDWKTGKTPFGTADLAGRQTAWETQDLWLRHEFIVPDDIMNNDSRFDALYLLNLLCDDTAEVYLNGELVTTRTTYTNYRYATLYLDPKAGRLLGPGKNTLSIHVSNPAWAGYVDANLHVVLNMTAIQAKRRLVASQINDPWTQLAAAYFIHEDHAAMEEVIARHPAAGVAIGDQCMDVSDWKRALEIYNKAMPAEANDANVLLRRAKTYEKLNEWALAFADWQRAVAARPDLLQTVIDWHKRNARWKEAAHFSLLRVERQPDEALVYLDIAPALLLAEDQAAYNNLCRQAAEKFAASESHFDAERVLKTCLLRASNIDLAKPFQEKLIKLIDGGKLSNDFLPWAWGSRALAEYRSGDFEASTQSSTKAEESNPNPLSHSINLAIRALAQQRLGHLDAARATREECAQSIKQLQSMGDNSIDHDLLIAQILLQEAETLTSGNGD